MVELMVGGSAVLRAALLESSMADPKADGKAVRLAVQWVVGRAGLTDWTRVVGMESRWVVLTVSVWVAMKVRQLAVKMAAPRAHW
jgi:hypothetical protein